MKPLTRINTRLALLAAVNDKDVIDSTFLNNARNMFLDACVENSVRMVLSICDIDGEELLNERMVGAWLGSVDIARNKAYTALAFSGPSEDEALPTHELGKLAQPGKPLFGIQNTNQGRIVIFGGGYPIYVGGRLVGGLGVSGSTVDVDQKIAEAALKAFENKL